MLAISRNDLRHAANAEILAKQALKLAMDEIKRLPVRLLDGLNKPVSAEREKDEYSNKTVPVLQLREHYRWHFCRNITIMATISVRQSLVG